MNFFQIIEDKGWYFFTTLLSGWPATLTVAVGSLAFALVFGLIVALLRMSRWKLLRWPATAYVEFFRGTPALVQLFVIYFGFPDVGFQPSPFQAAILGLGLNGAAYLSEIYRAGIRVDPPRPDGSGPDARHDPTTSDAVHRVATGTTNHAAPHDELRHRPAQGHFHCVHRWGSGGHGSCPPTGH